MDVSIYAGQRDAGHLSAFLDAELSGAITHSTRDPALIPGGSDIAADARDADDFSRFGAGYGGRSGHWPSAWIYVPADFSHPRICRESDFFRDGLEHGV